MKKYLTIAMLTMATLSYAAGWTTKVYEADPMKNTKTYVEYTYTDDNGNSFVWNTNDRENFVLKTTGSIFIAKDSPKYIIGLVGFYTKSGEFETKRPIMLVPNRPKTSLKTDDDFIRDMPLNPDIIAKVISYIVAGDGNVRFIFSRYDDTDFDLMVPRIEEPDMVYVEEIVPNP